MSKNPSIRDAMRAAATGQGKKRRTTEKTATTKKTARKRAQPAADVTEDAAEGQSSTVAKARVGKKMIAGYFDQDAARQLKALAVERDTTNQDLLCEALNDLFAKYKKAEIA